MTKEIHIDKNKSFSELDWSPGELIALDDTSIDFPYPLILAISQRIERGHNIRGINFLYCSFEREEWTLYPEGRAMGLWPPFREYAHFFHFRREFYKNPYCVETALTGEEAIINYFKNKQCFEAYGKCLESGDLITQRNSIEKFIQKIGLGFVLPSRLRFKNI